MPRVAPPHQLGVGRSTVWLPIDATSRPDENDLPLAPPDDGPHLGATAPQLLERLEEGLVHVVVERCACPGCRW